MAAKKKTTPPPSSTAKSSVAVRPAASAERHRVLRAQHETEAAQDYCEAIADLLDAGVEARVGRIAERFGLSHVTVSRVVRRLASEGLVQAQPHKPLGLTTRGRTLAAEAKRRHDLVIDFLRALGVDDRTAGLDAEGIEHHCSAATLRAMARYLGR